MRSVHGTKLVVACAGPAQVSYERERKAPLPTPRRVLHARHQHSQTRAFGLLISIVACFTS